MHRIVAGQANQFLEHYPPSQVASATWELQDITVTEDAAGRVLASGSATVDTFEEDTSALAGPATSNPRRISLEDTTNLTIGRHYEIVAVDESALVFELAGVNADAYALARWPLAGSFPSGSTVRGLRLVAGTAIPIGVYNDDDLLHEQRNLRVVWTYSTGSIVCVQAKLQRNTHGDLDHLGVAAKIKQIWPDINTRLEQHGRDIMGDLIAGAADELRTMLLAKGRPRPEQFLLGPTGEWACAWRVLANLAHTSHLPTNTSFDRWQDFTAERFREFWQPLIQGTQPAETVETDQHEDVAQPREHRQTIVLA